ncbi:hypothetical protein F5884DRAFT_789338 [Xylogone sp. PMI_703]|nr:hypothetical protein F5884DRAFT_789338 [Xylogone sp. PMI_703]
MPQFEGAALVVGAGGGIGRSVAEKLVEEGCTRIVLVDMNKEKLNDTYSSLKSRSSEHLNLVPIYADIRKEGDVDSMMKAAVEAFGSIHYCANCAGISPQPAASTDMNGEDFLNLIETNQRGTWLLVRSEVQQLLKQAKNPFGLRSARGSIVNVASVDAIASQPKLSSYAAVNHGIVGLTKSTASDYINSGIRLNVVCPSATETSFLNNECRADLSGCLPDRLLNDPAEIAEAVIFLLGPRSSAINGITLPVDRGWSLYHH